MKNTLLFSLTLIVTTAFSQTTNIRGNLSVNNPFNDPYLFVDTGLRQTGGGDITGDFNGTNYVCDDKDTSFFIGAKKIVFQQLGGNYLNYRLDNLTQNRVIQEADGDGTRVLSISGQKASPSGDVNVSYHEIDFNNGAIGGWSCDSNVAGTGISSSMFLYQRGHFLFGNGAGDLSKIGYDTMCSNQFILDTLTGQSSLIGISYSPNLGKYATGQANNGSKRSTFMAAKDYAFLSHESDTANYLRGFIVNDTMMGWINVDRIHTSYQTTKLPDATIDTNGYLYRNINGQCEWRNNTCSCTLQQTIVNNNASTYSAYWNNGSLIGLDNDNASCINWHSTTTGFSTRINAITPSSNNRFLKLPDTSGIFVISINGQTADSFGNVIISGGGSASPAGYNKLCQFNIGGYFGVDSGIGLTQLGLQYPRFTVRNSTTGSGDVITNSLWLQGATNGNTMVITSTESGSYKLPADGMTGNALHTDGSGNLYWDDINIQTYLSTLPSYSDDAACAVSHPIGFSYYNTTVHHYTRREF